jgi:hypothetical protein
MDCAVYSLWHNPGLLPLLLTPELVVAKLRGGADLMTPGLANGPPFPRGARKGAVVAVASLERPSVPLVVGVCEVDVAALESVVGAKGHAVRTVTWYGDELWAWGAGGRKGAEPPDAIEGWGGDGVEGAVAGVQQMDLGEGAGDSQAEEAAETVSDDEEEDDEAEKRTWSTAGMRIATRSAKLMLDRHRRGLPKRVFVRNHAVYGVRQPSALWHGFPDQAVVRHVQPRPAFPPILHQERLRSTANEKDVLENHQKVHQGP